jgi:PIN domain nuclease of toxin-antitoxin system
VNLVVDTHALVWHLLGADARLGRRARQAFREADRARWRLYVPSVCLMEIVLIEQKGHLKVDYHALREQLALRPGFAIEPLLPEDVDEARPLVMLPDPFDRLIAATALRLGVPLLTRDVAVTSSGVVPTVW